MKKLLVCLARARKIREVMTQHIGQGTVCSVADDLLKQGREAYDELEYLLVVRNQKNCLLYTSDAADE